MVSPLEMYSKYGLANRICLAKWGKLVRKWPMANCYFKLCAWWGAWTWTGSFDPGPCYCPWSFHPSGSSPAWLKFKACKQVTQRPLVGQVDSFHGGLGLTDSLKVSRCVCVCLCVRVCVSVCVCARAWCMCACVHLLHVHVQIHTYLCMYVYVCACVCLF